MADVICRRAGFQDAVGITDLFSHFFQAQLVGFGFMADFNGWFASTLNHLNNDPGFGAFVAEDAGKLIGACLVEIRPSWFAAWQLMGTELGWWIEPEYRSGRAGIRLQAMAEEWLVAQGASVLVFTGLANSPESVGRFYQKKGYRPLETHYVKVV